MRRFGGDDTKFDPRLLRQQHAASMCALEAIRERALVSRSAVIVATCSKQKVPGWIQWNRRVQAVTLRDDRRHVAA